MATIDTVLKLQDKMSAQLDKIEQAALKTNNAFQKVSISVDNVDKKMKQSEKTSGSFFNSLVKFELLKGVFSSIFGLITSQLDNAISRYDTLQNYTKVMANLGVSEEEADASRKRLEEGLRGLPTALDTAALAVQRFTSANNNVEASTEMYLAMNNALLAGGASMDLQKSAMEQLAQAYAKGKPDMMEWRALLQAMPGQLQQIAKAMNKTTTELGEDLRSGKTSMNEFMKAAIQLNQEGVDGFKSFAEQAETSTNGLQTAIANMQTAIQRGWTSLIEKANTSLQASGLPTINEIIKQIGNSIEQMMSKLGEETIPTLVSSFNDLGNSFVDMDAKFQDMTNNATKGFDILELFSLGIKGLVLGANTAWAVIKAIVMSIRVIFMTLVADIGQKYIEIVDTIAYAVLNPAQDVEDFINSIIGQLNHLIDAFNTAFGFLGANIPKIAESTLVKDTMSAYNEYSDMTWDMVNKAQEFKRDAVTDFNDFIATDIADLSRQANELVLLADKMRNSTETTATAINRAGSYDYNLIDELSNNVIGTDSTGSQAVKTTTNDDLLKDDDIQLLLDVATRDYKLNYQQVTPQITLTFGDIRETADVDNILDEVATRLEEIYDSDLEVVPV